MANQSRKNRRRKGEYVEDPNLGFSVDLSSFDTGLLDDPAKLLDWISSSNGSSKSDSKASSRTIARTRTVSNRRRSNKNKNGRGSAHREGRKATGTNSTRNNAKNWQVQSASKNRGVESVISHSGSLNGDKSVNEYRGKRWEIEYLRDNSIECIDRRDVGGALWVVGDYSIAAEIGFLRSCGLRLKYKQEGSRSTQGKSAWWTRDEAAQEPRELFCDKESNSESILKEDTQDSEALFSQELSNLNDEFNIEKVFSGSQPLRIPELVGILIGVTMDGHVNSLEAKALVKCLSELEDREDARVDNIATLLNEYLEDDVIDENEESHLLNLFNYIIKLSNNSSASEIVTNTSKDENIGQYNPDYAVKETDASEAGHDISLPRDIEYLRSIDCKCVDLRPKGGALWVIGDRSYKSVVDNLQRLGMHFSFSETGSSATKYEQGWWTKDAASIEHPEESSIGAYEKQTDIKETSDLYPNNSFKIYIPDGLAEDLDIDYLFISARAYILLRRQGIERIVDFRHITFGEMCNYPNSSIELAEEIFSSVEELLESL